VGGGVVELVAEASATIPETAVDDDGVSAHRATGVVPPVGKASVACATWLLPESLTVAPSVEPIGARAAPCHTAEPSAKTRRSPAAAVAASGLRPVVALATSIGSDVFTPLKA
jgi:hypothetical protein